MTITDFIDYLQKIKFSFGDLEIKSISTENGDLKQIGFSIMGEEIEIFDFE